MKHKIANLSAQSLSDNWLGDNQYEVGFVTGLSNTDFQCLSFYKGDDIERVKNTQSGILIVKEIFKDKVKEFQSKCLVFTENPMNLFVDIINARFNNDYTDKKMLSRNDVKISDFAYVESEVAMGEGSTVYPNATVYNGTVMGSNCEVQSGTVVGGIGMSYVEDKDVYKRLIHLGNVIIEDNVDIGCNTTILRGILESTKIGKGSKVGNHVNIGHNTKIGENSYISAGVIIGGATVVGDNCWIAPGVSIRDHIKIGDNTTVGVGSVVVKDLEPNSVYYGSPAKLARKKTT